MAAGFLPASVAGELVSGGRMKIEKSAKEAKVTCEQSQECSLAYRIAMPART